MLEQLKASVCAANIDLVKNNLVVLTWGNVSAITEDRKYIVIKPSGVSYESMVPEQMVITDLNGNIVEGNFRPSSDLPTHIELYKAFENVNSVVHTHSTWATIFAQAELDVPCYGTTHADQFYGTIPCTRTMLHEEVETDYEKNTGLLIVDTFAKREINPEAVPAVLVNKHGPFTWGSTPQKAVDVSVTLEEVCNMAAMARLLNPDITVAPQYLEDKHYHRKHGNNSYYGQY